ncbi:MAG: hypothetical protein ACQ5SW_09625 [Sphaerochaetaceae bacterium]
MNIWIAAQVAQDVATSGAQTLIVSAISAIVAGLGVKLVTLFIDRGSVKIDEATQIRSELRDRSKSLGEQLNAVTDNRDYWKERYYQLLSDHEEVRLELEIAKLIIARHEEDKRKA